MYLSDYVLRLLKDATTSLKEPHKKDREFGYIKKLFNIRGRNEGGVHWGRKFG